MNLKEKFYKKLNKKLNLNQRKMLTLFSVIGAGKSSLVFQMPAGVIALDSVWDKIRETATEMKVDVSVTTGTYATLEDLDKILGDIDWLWHRWIPKGFTTMLAGDPGIGKSALVQHFVKIVTSGGTFPLMEEPLGKPQNVVWIDTEASQQILKVRANSMGIDKSKVFIPSIMGDMLSQPDLAINNNREYIVNMIADLKPVLMVLDSLGGSHTRGENKVEDIKPVLEFLALLSRDYQMASIVIHHLNKGHNDESPEVSLYRLRGSTVIPAMCRSIFAIEPSFDKRLKIRMVKSNLARVDQPIAVIPQLDEEGDFTGFLYEPYVPPPPKRNKKEMCSDWVYSMLQQHGADGVPLTTLIEAGAGIGFSRGNIYASREILGERISFSGTGNKAFWHAVLPDTQSVNKIIKQNGSNGRHAKPKKKGS